MKTDLATHVSHYFERDYGAFLNICDLGTDEMRRIIDTERNAETGFNRFSYGEDFFDFRKLADDLLLTLYSEKFERPPERRPFYSVLGDSDVVGGLYRDPYKVRIPIEELEPHEVTFMCPDHFHLVGLSKIDVKQFFGMQAPDGWDEESHPYFGKLLTYVELVERFSELKLDTYLEERIERNDWYRYIEAQIWADPEDLRSRFCDWVEVHPEPWSSYTVTHLQNYKQRAEQAETQQPLSAALFT